MRNRFRALRDDLTRALRQPTPWTRLALDVAMLDALGGACLLILWAFGSEGDGVAAYCRELEGYRVASVAFLGYCLWMTLYAAGVEILLRGAQGIVSRRLGVGAGIVGAATLYALSHSRYGALNAVYAFALGCCCGACFARTRRLGSMIAWHIQWDFAALAFILFSTRLFSA
jgi:membrane protease YdiL (CAAX protease family)